MATKSDFVKRYLDEYGMPVETRRRCIHCNCHLGIQNPNWTCGLCDFISRSYYSY